MEDVFWGLMIPLLGTTLGAACVFFMRGRGCTDRFSAALRDLHRV